MNTNETRTVPDLRGYETPAWVAAVLTYGVGDALSTLVAVSWFGLPESNPVYLTAFEAWGVLPALVGLKALGFVGLFVLYRRWDDDRTRAAVPLGVAAAGGLIVGWNTVMVLLLGGVLL